MDQPSRRIIGRPTYELENFNSDRRGGLGVGVWDVRRKHYFWRLCSLQVNLKQTASPCLRGPPGTSSLVFRSQPCLVRGLLSAA